MFALTNKPEMGARLYAGLIELATESSLSRDGDSLCRTDVMKVIQHVSGILVETYFVFENPDEAMEASFDKLGKLLGCEPFSGSLVSHALPPAHIIVNEIERGRNIARTFFGELLDCVF